MTQKVKLHFTLTGKTNEWKRTPLKDNPNVNNEDVFNFVKNMVIDYFGNRALVIMNEKLLKDNSITYPKFYSAGWFFSSDNKSELVLVNHGSSIEEANSNMINSMKNINWEKLSVRV